MMPAACWVMMLIRTENKEKGVQGCIKKQEAAPDARAFALT
jgi:hypothetical protein